MHATQPTSATHQNDRPGPAGPDISRRVKAAVALTVGGAAIAAGAAATTAPALAFITANHNETVVRTQPPSRRAKAAIAVGGMDP